jgi:hypothetical protein
MYTRNQMLSSYNFQLKIKKHYKPNVFSWAIAIPVIASSSWQSHRSKDTSIAGNRLVPRTCTGSARTKNQNQWTALEPVTCTGNREVLVQTQMATANGRLPACSVGWWLMAGADLFWEKSTAGWLLVAGLFWEKSTAGWWLISQANRARLFEHTPILSYQSGGINEWSLVLTSTHFELTACSFGWWLMAGADLFWEKSTAGWLLMAGLFWEKSTASWWLISQANGL